MKPTLIRNKTIYQATNFVKSKLLCSHLSKDLQQKFNKRSVRVTEGDTVRVLRGEFKGVSGKITRVSTEKNGAAVEGIKKEKLKGGNLDVFIHTSNLLVTELNTEDKWRAGKIEGKNLKPQKESKPKVAPKEEKQKETKSEPKPEPKKAEKKPKPKDSKESKPAKKTKKVDK
jgi:large subunit ribosomal protein L24